MSGGDGQLNGKNGPDSKLRFHMNVATRTLYHLLAKRQTQAVARAAVAGEKTA
jgi:hypothetical protein